MAWPLFLVLAATCSCSAARVLRSNQAQLCTSQGACEPCSFSDLELPHCRPTHHAQRLTCQLSSTQSQPGSLHLMNGKAPASWTLLSSTDTQATYAVSCQPTYATSSSTQAGDSNDDSDSSGTSVSALPTVLQAVGETEAAAAVGRALQAASDKGEKGGKAKVRKHRKVGKGKKAAKAAAVKEGEADAEDDEEEDDEGEEVKGEQEEVVLQSVKGAAEEAGGDTTSKTASTLDEKVKPGVKEGETTAAKTGVSRSQQATAVSKLEGVVGQDVKMQVTPGGGGKQVPAGTQRTTAAQPQARGERVVQVDSVDQIEEATSGTHSPHGWSVWTFELAMLSMVAISLPVVYWRKLRIRHL